MQPCVNLCRVPDSERNEQRFADLLNEVIDRTHLTEHDIGHITGRSRSQVNQWRHGNHLPKVEALLPLTDLLRTKYQGLGTLPTELLIAAGYRAFATRGQTAAAETPARGFVIDLADENERILWSLRASRRVKEVMVAFWRMVNTPPGENAVNTTFDEARRDRMEDHRRRA